MLLPAAGLIIAAAPATERRRCRGKPPFPCPTFPRPPLRVATPGSHPGSPPRNSCSKHQFSSATKNSVTKKGGVLVTDGVCRKLRDQKGVFLVTNEVCRKLRDQKGRFLVTDGVRRRVGAAGHDYLK